MCMFANIQKPHFDNTELGLKTVLVRRCILDYLETQSEEIDHYRKGWV